MPIVFYLSLQQPPVPKLLLLLLLLTFLNKSVLNLIATINIANNVLPSVKSHTYFKVKFFIVRHKFLRAIVFSCFRFVLCSSSITCTDILAQISSRFYHVHSFTVFPPSKVDFFSLKSGKKYDTDSDQDKDALPNQLPNQFPPESNLIKKESVAHNRVRTKVGKQKTLFTNGGGESAQLVTAQAQFTSNGAHA